MPLTSPKPPRPLDRALAPTHGEAIDRVAERFAVATDAQRDARDLLRRVDTKFVCDRASALAILASLTPDYAALAVPGGNVATYRSLYFDTPELRCFHDHRCGRRLRHKVRIRHYPDRALSYLELKTKRNDVITDKRRLAIPFQHEALDAERVAFLRAHIALPVEALAPAMRVGFRRISLIGLRTAERVTLDLDLEATLVDGGRQAFGDLVVIEVKQAPFCVRTPVMRAIAAAGLRERSMSKYTIATALLRPELRQNRLLPDVRAIGRMIP